MTDREAPEREASHKLGEVLRTAREARGVDLARVERDTKIRARYLSALERGEYRELPGPVYTKGFLRNYGAYLGLDPEYLVDLYRLESSTAAIERPSVQPPPRPLATRRGRAFVLTPGVMVGALLTVGVIAFVVYMVSEFVTFAQTPELRITDPLGDVAAYQELSYRIKGVTEPNSTITIEGAVENPTVTADAEGAFEVEVRLVPGSNVLRFTARDPLTNRDSETQSRTIVVGGDLPSASPGGALALTAPAEGAAVSAPVALAGTAPPNATVAVAATFVSAAPPTFAIVNLANQPVPIPTAPPAAPAPLSLTADAAGAFEGSMDLPPGTWQLTLSAVPGASGEVTLTRQVVVQPPAGLAGTLSVQGAQSYLEVYQDDQVNGEVSFRNAQPGTTVPLQAQGTLRIRAGNAGAVHLVLNGIDLGVMGGSGSVIEWHIARQ
ncbi:MAG TPA: RodZ domain-containing protein [Candidatus Limnocylindria bacterium]